MGCRGFPFWLHDVPGIVYRTDNEPFKVHHLLHCSSQEASNSHAKTISGVVDGSFICETLQQRLWK